MRKDAGWFCHAVASATTSGTSAESATAVLRVVAGEKHGVAPSHRRAAPVVVPRHGSQVEQHHHDPVAVAADVGVDRVVPVVGVEPAEPREIGIGSPQLGAVTVDGAEVFEKALEPRVERLALEVPVDAAVVIPLPAHADLAAHEHQRLAGPGVLVGEECAQIGELLPVVARHLGEQRAFAVHHFVVRERHDEVLAVLVHHAEGEQLVVIAAVDGVHREIVQRVVHPSHVPLEGEAQPALRHRTRHPRPAGGLLGHGETAGVLIGQRGVQALQELHGLEVLATAVLVRHPLPLATAVVEIQHRRDRVDPQAIDVELLQPVERVGHQEIPHLPPAVVEDQRAPLRVLAPPRIGVLVERRAVEQAQGEIVLGEMGRDPVHDDADARGVARVDQVAEVVGRAVPRGGREVRAHLVAPRPGERMLGERHELDVAEAQPLDVLDQPRGDLAVGERAVALLEDARPGTEVDFVHRER